MKGSTEMDHRDGMIAKQIIALQNEDGTWGNEFHSLAVPTNRHPLTTEQALRRLKILGYTIEDAPIRKAVDCMTACLRRERKIDDYWEKTQDWDLYTQLMLSTWVKIFDPENELASAFAGKWANVIEAAFEGGEANGKAYCDAYVKEFQSKAKAPREVDFVTFYVISLLQGMLTEKTERRMLDYVIAHPKGIYYIYDKPLSQPPDNFNSRQASCYLAAIELLTGYETAKEKLGFVVDWLELNRDENGQWDMGAKVKDQIYFPLSDSWKKGEDRKQDCTDRISVLLGKLKV